MSTVAELVRPGLSAFASRARPAPARTDDGNPWVTGMCWLYCGHRITRVTWLGPASTAGISAPIHACQSCLGMLNELIWQYEMRRETFAPVEPAEEPAVPGRPKHRKQSRWLQRTP